MHFTKYKLQMNLATGQSQAFWQIQNSKSIKVSWYIAVLRGVKITSWMTDRTWFSL